MTNKEQSKDQTKRKHFRIKTNRFHSFRPNVGLMEAIDGTPVIDIKPVIDSNDYRRTNKFKTRLAVFKTRGEAGRL